ncbi:hypothetical protein OIU80_16750 [Flavobacterium sp. LS1R47]|jgi:hypothetical protein|uniref:Uncharacterized protein n=1 Tax=Flavobacterium frigoritolerans TaxID=2987686 RepID=A0A9X3C987_9FLAO|nr:hypothetical protein [Flavobacterium frigoritolerans]MCV9933934.1 hypothetical protein [Flavobacterium frigoritolerans]
MIVKAPKKIASLIGETSPYLFENAEKIDFNQSSTEIPLYKSFESYEKENFSDLLKILSTLGSLSLANELKTNDKRYFLGERLRIRKISYTQPSGLLSVKIASQLESSQKGRALIEIVDENTKIFQMEMDYFIIDEPSFNKIFESHYSAEQNKAFTSVFPSSSFEYLNEEKFNITIEEFTRNHCLGHFDNYEIVPAAFVGKCILKNIFESSTDPNLEIENIEIFLNKAMPINTVFTVNVKILRVSKNLKKYKCTVTDTKTEYGHYFITIKNQPTF